MRLAQVSLLLCGATAYVPAFSTHRPTRPTRPAAARLAMPVAATTGARTGGDGRRSPRRKESAANALLQKIDGLRSTRAVPVDATGLSSLVRPLADGLRGPMLLEVLSGLRQRGKWETALALAQMVEANAPAAPPAGRTPRYGAPAAPMNAPGRKEISGRTGGAPEWERRAGRDDLASRGGAMGRDAEGGSGLASLEDSDALLARARAAAAAISSGRGYSGDGYSEDGYSWDEADEGDEFGAGVAAGPPLETVHYNVLLSTLAVARRWREALDLLTRMRERSVPRDTVRVRLRLTPPPHKSPRPKSRSPRPLYPPTTW
jgi:pentatricopeptide repeat protein